MGTFLLHQTENSRTVRLITRGVQVAADTVLHHCRCDRLVVPLDGGIQRARRAHYRVLLVSRHLSCPPVAPHAPVPPSPFFLGALNMTPMLGRCSTQIDFLGTANGAMVLSIFSDSCWWLLIVIPMYMFYKLWVSCIWPWIQQDPGEPIDPNAPRSRKERRAAARGR